MHFIYHVRISRCIILYIITTDNVEMEIVLPGSMTVIDSHDIALALQHKIEAMIDVERAFVHVDHQERDGLEHKVLIYSLCFPFVRIMFSHKFSVINILHLPFFSVSP
jgi:Dimerisation domain of Zinc Transporter